MDSLSFQLLKERIEVLGTQFDMDGSLDPDADSVTKIPGDGFGPDMLERGLSEAIKTDLLFGELELVAERIAPRHLKKPCSVSLLDMMKTHLTSEAEAAGESTASADRANPVVASGAPYRSCWLCQSKLHWDHACCFLLWIVSRF